MLAGLFLFQVSVQKMVEIEAIFVGAKH